MKNIKLIFYRTIGAFKIVTLFFFLFLFLNLAGLLAIPLVILSIPWYIINGKGILHFFNEQVKNESKD